MFINRVKMVIVRAFAGQLLVRRVWSYDESAVYIVDESAYIRLLSGEDVMPIGFRREDVFRYDPAMTEQKADRDRADRHGERMTPPWGDMELWREEPE
jgi:hypothetical protein